MSAKTVSSTFGNHRSEFVGISRKAEKWLMTWYILNESKCKVQNYRLQRIIIYTHREIDIKKISMQCEKLITKIKLSPRTWG